jgi:hypothetical protein
MKKSLPENCMIVIGVALIFLGFVNRMADFAAFFVGFSLTLFYFFMKIPSALDKHFRTKVFRRDLALRFSFVVFPLAMFLTLFVYYPFAYFFLPEPLQIIRVSYGLEVGMLATVALIFAFIPFYSWRLWRYPDVALRLWRKASDSQKEFEWDVQQSETGGNLSALNRFLSPGVAPMVIAVLLFLALLILRMFDVMLIGFLLLWLGHNVLHELGQRQSQFLRASTPAIRFFRFFDQTVTWEGILRIGLRGNVSGIWDTFVLFLCFFLLIIPSVSSLAGFIVMFGFLSSWYLIIVLVQIMRRLGVVVNKAEAKSNRLHVLPPHADLALTGMLSLFAIFSLLMAYPLLEPKTRLGAILSASLAVNTINFFSIWCWTRESEKPKQKTNGTYSNRDRYRIYAIFLFSGLPIALVESSTKDLLFWMTFSGAVILLSLSGRMLSKTSKSTPRICAACRTLYMTLIVCLIFGSAMWYFPESRLTLEILAPLIGFLVAVMGVLFYRWRKYSLKTAQTHADQAV